MGSGRCKAALNVPLLFRGQIVGKRRAPFNHQRAGEFGRQVVNSRDAQ